MVDPLDRWSKYAGVGGDILGDGNKGSGGAEISNDSA